jgi:NitT/TauT family transport system substrate-binding protein
MKKFRDSIAEAASIANSDRDKASASIAKFTKQPIELVKMSPHNQSEPALKAEQLSWWIEIMSSQKVLQSKLELDRLILR